MRARSVALAIAALAAGVLAAPSAGLAAPPGGGPASAWRAGLAAGWYRPSLAKLDAALEYARARFAARGDDALGAGFAVGAFVERRGRAAWSWRAEVSRWERTVRLAAASVEGAGTGEARASARLVPVTITLLTTGARPRLGAVWHAGVGCGVLLSRVEVDARLLEDGASGAREVLAASDRSAGPVVQVVAGARPLRAAPFAPWIELRIVGGEVRIEEPRYGVDERVVLSGANVVVGASFWGHP